MDYNNGKVHFLMMQRIKELRLRYYVSADMTVMIRWNGVWTPYGEVMVKDSRLKV